MPEPEPLLRDPRFQPEHVIGALLEADRLGWLTRAEALAAGRMDCEECGANLPGLR